MTSSPRRVESSLAFSESRSAQRVFDLIDGTRSVAGIVLHSHAAEFLVTKLLTALLHEQVLEVLRTGELV